MFGKNMKRKTNQVAISANQVRDNDGLEVLKSYNKKWYFYVTFKNNS